MNKPSNKNSVARSHLHLNFSLRNIIDSFSFYRYSLSYSRVNKCTRVITALLKCKILIYWFIRTFNHFIQWMHFAQLWSLHPSNSQLWFMNDLQGHNTAMGCPFLLYRGWRGYPRPSSHRWICLLKSPLYKKRQGLECSRCFGFRYLLDLLPPKAI